MSWIRRLKEALSSPSSRPSKPAPPAQSQHAEFWDRAPSFSLIALPGDASSWVPGLLCEAGYTLGALRRFSGPYSELDEALRDQHQTPGSTLKAWYQVPGFTIVLDPEMVLHTSEDALTQYAGRAGRPVLVAIWERVSEMAMLVELDGTGPVRRTSCCEGKVAEEPLRPHEQLAANPSAAGLLSALAAHGLSASALFGPVDAMVQEVRS